ncbi:MAG TPA: RES domain-containing protein [Gemmatimonadales bacterium]|nr:RES domain-containing protein [Gemmatimonadales bacterium]
MPVAWRIVKTRRAKSPFDGEGARLFGGRWTSPGRAVVYTADSAALATLEILVHLGSGPALAEYSLVSVTIPSADVATVDVAKLPDDWRSYPAPAALREIGDQWFDAGKTAVLRVPSAVVPAEFNYLIDPKHPRFKGCKIGKPTRYAWDRRLGR